MRSFYSFYLDATKIALQSIFAHKMRAFLTLIGIIIGVASVVVVGASINGLNTYVTTQISKVLGVNHFMIARMAAVGHLTDEEWDAMNKRNKPLRWDDMEWLQHQCSTCTEIGAQANTSQDLKYEWNRVGNLTLRQDGNRSLTERFYYDNAHRLDYATLNGAPNLDVGYDIRGNIVSKTGVGTYAYSPAHVHAVASINTGRETLTYSYDANGNMTRRAGSTCSAATIGRPTKTRLPSSTRRSTPAPWASTSTAPRRGGVLSASATTSTST
jgi:hypothetical protein